MVFRDLTEPLISYYKTNEHFLEVDASQNPDAITRFILSDLGQGPPAT